MKRMTGGELPCFWANMEWILHGHGVKWYVILPPIHVTCTHKPKSYLELRGLCRNSAIDRYYKPIFDSMDSQKLELQGLKQTSLTWQGDCSWMWPTQIRQECHEPGLHPSRWESTTRRSRVATEGSLMSMSWICREFTCNDDQCVSMEQRYNQLLTAEINQTREIVISWFWRMYTTKKVPPVNVRENVNMSVAIELLGLADVT